MTPPPPMNLEEGKDTHRRLSVRPNIPISSKCHSYVYRATISLVSETENRQGGKEMDLTIYLENRIRHIFVGV